MAVTKRERAKKILSQIRELYPFLNCDDEFDQAISDMKKMDKVEKIFEIKEFGEYPCTYEDMCREIIKIVKGE